MNYLLYGNEELLIKKEINNILKKHHIDEINKCEYQLDSTSLQTIIDDALTISLFGEQKAIIVENAYIFTGIIPKGAMEQDLNLLVDYITKDNPNTILIFTTTSPKLDERKKITKKMKELGTVKEFKTAKDLTETVISMFKPYQISTAIASFFWDRVGKELYTIEQEIEKIKTYKSDDLEITKEDILQLTSKNVDTDIFNLIENIISNHKKEALETYHEMLKQNEEPIKIVIMLANQFRLLYQTKGLVRKGYSSSDIASELGIHPYRVKLALEKGRKYSDSLLLSYLDKLAQIDYEIKSGMTEKSMAIELFILEK